ncbi:TPA: MSHA biogenesis protein MshQ [Aeromonas sobria]|nr:MSHA biogenesis protein MshQ [Aeromonas sobria]
MMDFKWLVSLLLFCGTAVAQQYNLSINQYPPCNTTWQKSGNVYTCTGGNGQVTLNDGDVIVANQNSTLSADGGFYLTNNKVGNASSRITLKAGFGSIISQGYQNTIYGDIFASSSNVTLNNIYLYGNVTTSGNISLNSGVVQGNITSSSSSVSVTNVQLSGDISANSSVTMSGGTYSGNITMRSNNPVTFNSVNMTSGSVSGASSFNATGSQLGSQGSPVIISTTSNDITVTNSTVYGNLTAATNNAGGIVNVNNSSVTGTCLPVSNPVNACVPAPVALYQLEENKWTGVAGEVKNSVADVLHGRAMRGAKTNTVSPALPVNSSNLGTCGYAEFTGSSSQYIEVSHESRLSFSNQLTVSAWVYPVSRPSAGNLHSIVSKDGNYEFHLDSQGRVFWYWERSSGVNQTLTTNTKIPLNTWSHIVIRYDAIAATNQRQKIYINGIADTAMGNDASSLRTNSQNLEIGRDYIDSRSFNGRIDEVAIYGSALSDAQIAELYNQRHPCGGSTLICETDDFTKPLGDRWVVKQSAGGFIPSITANQRLRMTQASTGQATSATYQRLFPAVGNLVTLTFNHYAYGGTSTGADGMTVVLSDASVTPQPGAAGGPLGYGHYQPSNSPGFAGGWLGFGLDEFGNFSSFGGGDSVGYRPQAVVVRGSGSNFSGYNYLRGTCKNGSENTDRNCLSPKVDGNGSANHRYRLTIDSRASGRALVKVERDTGSGFVALIDSFDALDPAFSQSPLPQDFYLSLTGSTGALTNIHELDNVQICALKSREVGVQVDHFELQHSGQPLTCNPEEITIKACANPDCSLLITDPVSASLLPESLPDGGWFPLSGASNVSGNTVTFTGGVGKVLLRNHTQTPVTLGVKNSVPAVKPLSETLCKAGAGTPSAAACTLNFADSGFFFDVPDTYSNQPQTVSIKAVKKSDVTKQCVPGFASQTKSVKFWSSYITPTSNPYNSQMSVNSSAIGTSEGAATPFSLAFDSQGQSTITVNYPDAGKVQLDARYDGTGSEAGLVMLGADQFVARPVGLCITPPQGVCAAGDSSCPVFKKAGDTFQVDIKAMAWESANDGDICAGNQTTPNFVLSNIALGSTLVAPSPGTNATLGTTAYNHVAAANSANSVSQTVSEVGVFRMTATPPVAKPPEGSTASTGYFGYTIPPASSVPVGRFVPWDYSLSGGFITPACNAFTYMSQPFASGFVLTARNLQQGTTQNYQGAFAKGVAEMVAANALDGVARDKRITLSPSLSWASGIASVNQQSPLGLNTRFDRAASPEAPFATLSFGIKVDDKDGGTTLLANPNMNAAVAGACAGASCDAVRLGTQKLLYGRLLAGTEAGVASAPLAIPQRMQYYEAGNWLLNKEDQCTQLSLANQGFTFINPSHTFDAATRELNLGAGRKIKLGLGSSTPGGDAALAKDGVILFHFAKPDISVRIPYKVDLAKQPSSPTWLSDPISLQGEAIFGSSRGNDRIIYRREVMQ